MQQLASGIARDKSSNIAAVKRWMQEQGIQVDDAYANTTFHPKAFAPLDAILDGRWPAPTDQRKALENYLLSLSKGQGKDALHAALGFTVAQESTSFEPIEKRVLDGKVDNINTVDLHDLLHRNDVGSHVSFAAAMRLAGFLPNEQGYKGLLKNAEINSDTNLVLSQLKAFMTGAGDLEKLNPRLIRRMIVSGFGEAITKADKELLVDAFKRDEILEQHFDLFPEVCAPVQAPTPFPKRADKITEVDTAVASDEIAAAITDLSDKEVLAPEKPVEATEPEEVQVPALAAIEVEEIATQGNREEAIAAPRETAPEEAVYGTYLFGSADDIDFGPQSPSEADIIYTDGSDYKPAVEVPANLTNESGVTATTYGIPASQAKEVLHEGAVNDGLNRFTAKLHEALKSHGVTDVEGFHEWLKENLISNIPTEAQATRVWNGEEIPTEKLTNAIATWVYPKIGDYDSAKVESGRTELKELAKAEKVSLSNRLVA